MHTLKEQLTAHICRCRPVYAAQHLVSERTKSLSTKWKTLFWASRLLTHQCTLCGLLQISRSDNIANKKIRDLSSPQLFHSPLTREGEGGWRQARLGGKALRNLWLLGCVCVCLPSLRLQFVPARPQSRVDVVVCVSVLLTSFISCCLSVSCDTLTVVFL